MNLGRTIKLIVIVLVAIFLVGVCIAVGFQSFQNKAISLEEQVYSAASDIEVQEKRRADLIPNLVECVKAYDEHEYETLMSIVVARGKTAEGSAEIQTLISAVAEP